MVMSEKAHYGNQTAVTRGQVLLIDQWNNVPERKIMRDLNQKLLLITSF